ncbi:MAG: hypothetical protein E3J52_10860 [Promethearchaeota archaeon]|nr:MAG: hypothetical protein E3J52_10860 [Candidatus Lokiarchaeota archaeon]
MFGKCFENEIDLEDKREILKEECLKKAEDLRCSFIETSTLHNINVQDTFKIVGIGLKKNIKSLNTSNVPLKLEKMLNSFLNF